MAYNYILRFWRFHAPHLHPIIPYSLRRRSSLHQSFPYKCRV
jgi:hypothetical protein